MLIGDPERTSFQLSSTGAFLAWLAPSGGVLNIWVRDLSTPGAEARVVTAETTRRVQHYFWTRDDRYLCYGQDSGGDEDFHLLVVDLLTGEVHDRTPFAKVRALVGKLSDDHPERLLIAMNREDPSWNEPYLLTLATGELEKVLDNRAFRSFAAHDDLVVRAASRMESDGTLTFFGREVADAPWRELLRAGSEDTRGTGIIGFDRTGSRLRMLSSVGRDTSAVIEIDMISGEETVVFEDPTYDVSDVVTHPVTGDIIAVAVTADRVRWEVLNPAYAVDFSVLQEQGLGDLEIVTTTSDFSRWLVAFKRAQGGAIYFLYDRISGALNELARTRPELDDYALADKEPICFTARDGLLIHGYVSFPPGVERKGLPAVLNVHGGPWSRDTYGFSADVQLLATRGYAVIQVNFRGSRGYGKAFLNAANKQWGKAMHDDLIDAVDHVVGQGWVDRRRIAIYGGSYGGYATLVGLTLTPEIFACGVDVVGPSHLQTLLGSLPEYWKPGLVQWHDRVGHPVRDADLLEEVSPLNHIDSIVRPLLIGQGRNDPRVKEEQSELIVTAMRAKGIPVEYVCYPDEGHGFARPENRLDFYNRMIDFLATHLPV